MTDEPNDLVAEGIKLVKRWDSAKSELEKAKSQMRSRECDLTNAESALGKWLCPSDAKVGESFSVWHGNRLIICTWESQNTYHLSIRKRDKK